MFTRYNIIQEPLTGSTISEVIDLVWTIASFVAVALLVICWLMIVRNNKLPQWAKILWILETAIAPVIGPILYFVYVLASKKEEKKK